MKKITCTALIVFFYFTSLLSQEMVRPVLLAIVVQNIDSSIFWYSKNLGFELDGSVNQSSDNKMRIALLKNDNFWLELIENKESISPDKLISSNEEYLSGIFKMGFLVDDIDNLYNTLKMREVELITSVNSLPDSELEITWPDKFFITKDIDGNMIQFFNKDKSIEKKGLQPWLVMITTGSLTKSINWYSENLDFKHHLTVGDKGNQRAILEKNGIVLELYQPHKVTFAHEHIVEGYAKLAFGTLEFDATERLLKSNKVVFDTESEASSLYWANKAMIIKDFEGNSIQIFGLKLR